MKMTKLVSFCRAMPIALFLLVTISARGLSAAVPGAAPELIAGRLRLTLESGAKMRLWVDGVPFITDSHLYLVKPGWTGVLLNTDRMTPVLTTSVNGGAQTATADFENVSAFARYRFELRSDNTLVVRLTYGTKADPDAPNSRPIPAEIEYTAGYVNANVLAGRPFTADSVGGAVSGLVPVSAKSADEETSRLTPTPIRKLSVDSLLGPVTIAVQGTNAVNSALSFFDARRQTESWATAHPIFWLGVGSPALPVPQGENTVTITYTFGPASARTLTDAMQIPTSHIVSVPKARAPDAPDLPIIPKPKEMRAGTSPLRLSTKTRIVMPAHPVPEESASAREIQAELKTFWGLDVSAVVGARPHAGDIVLGGVDSARAIDTGRNSRAVPPPPVPEKAEGYSISAGAGGATLIGHDLRGVYDAAQTFKQLIRADARGVYVKPVTIRDWPTLAFRGVQWYGGPNSFPFHQRMIDRILAPLKYNAMVLQAEYTAWDTQPKLRSDRTTPKSETRKTIAEARAHFVEPIPLVPALGHMQWFFQKGQNRDLAADPTHPYTIDPENPRAYDILYPLYEEIINLFHPRIFHIGHDEVTMEGVFPHKSSAKTTTELYLQSVNQLHDWLAKRNIRTMLWGDMLLAPGEGTAANAASREDSAARRAGIPKDVLVGDWHYSGTDYPSIGLLEKAGFETVASTWYDGESNHLFAKEAAKQDAFGLLQTTWAGYTMALDQVKTDSFPQFVAYLIGAEQAWNGGANDLASLGYDPSEAFLAFYDRKPYDSTKHTGFTVNLSDAANTPSKAIQLSGALNPAGTWTNSVTVALGERKASSLVWTWATTFAANWGSAVATVSVVYADGREETVPILYGRQIAAFSDPRSPTDARHASGGYGFEWTNPRPDVAIATVTLTSAGAEAAPVLAGLTGVE